MVRSGALVRYLALCSITLVATQAFSKAPSNKTSVFYPSASASTQPLRELPIDQWMVPSKDAPEPQPSPLSWRAISGPMQPDSVLQKEVLPSVSASKGIDFDGIPRQGWSPPDPNIAVGPNHIGEVVNVRLAFYNKSGALLSGPTNINTLFTQVGGSCASAVVDPIVLYDRQADRWVIAGIGDSSTFAECMAVSKTNDPTGSYSVYSYNFGSTLNDYDKLSTWATASNGAYLATYNIFNPGFVGADLCGFDRSKMLAGASNPAMLCQLTPNSEGSYLPADMDGPTPPVDGTPGLFLTWQNNNPGQLYLRKLTLDFTAGTANLSAPTVINVANDNLACGNGGTCVPQSGTSQILDTLGDRLMYRFAIRHFSDHDRAVVTHAVANTNQVAFRWYELYDPAGSITLNQQGTFAPDSTYRWMSSMSEDQNANIGVGYSASSSSLHPAVRFTGRVPSDALGTLESEASLFEGTGSQSTTTRWGDYTALQVDPSDDCTFWYVGEHVPTTGSEWSTRVGSFLFSGCGGGGGPAVTLSPTSLKWGKILVGKTTGAKTVTLTNSGNATLSISSIVTSGDFALKTVRRSCGTTVNAGASCLIKVTFTPTQTGVRTGTVSITDNAPSSPQTISLAGTGK